MIIGKLLLAGVVLLSQGVVYASEETPDTVDGIEDWDAEEINKEAKSRGYTFKAGESWVTRRLKATKNIREVTGYLGQGENDKTARVYIQPDIDLPETYDLRRNVAGGLQPVRNQGACGSCWAFATTSTLESLAILHDPYGARHDLSEQQVLSCSKAGSCGGGYFTAFNYMKKGVGAEAEFPYKARDLRCKTLEPKEQIISWSYIKGQNGGEPSVEQIKTAIMQYGPLAVTVNGNFSSYKSGIYNRCSRGGVNHMVNLEGWDNETKSWIMRNSWGQGWGEKGYMRIAWTDKAGRKCNRIGETAAFAVVPTGGLE